ncbi:MFS transporter [Sphingomonas aerophila]|uniref:MFS family permease n=1 Tax=Sphingomonas aerophila TaxID=1344948 RepID=A0A7W9BBX7_9SPHN|nr:MFS transporter [Sphingomonas aerophila]MBB5714399.1 MFS family permease [Sphingomonas aerophila]
MPAAVLPRRSTATLILFALAYAGGVIGYLPLLTLLLPVKVEALAGDARLDVLTAIVISGAIVASASNILWGWLSDRSVARGQGRRGWLIGGVAGTALAYAGIAAAATPAQVIAAVILFQVAVNAALAPLIAMMADEVPDAQKGTLGGLLAFANPVAAGLSAGLVATPALGETGRLLLVPLAMIACVVPLLALLPPSTPIDAEDERPLPGRTRDMAVAWAARLLVQVAGNVLFLYLLYYFESIAADLPRTELQTRTGHLLTLSYLLPLPVALIAGRLSDRSGRRRPVLLAAAAAAALGLCGMAAAASWIEGALAFTTYAVGSAVFLALHSAYAMQLLPSVRHRGRDLGLLNLTNTLPALAGPLLTWWLASPRDFEKLMLLLAALTLAGGLTLLAARPASRPA